MVWVMMSVSVIIGFFFMTGFAVSPAESILYSAGTLLPKGIWGTALFITASTAIMGFVLDSDKWIVAGGLWGFMVWAFACIALIMASQWYVLITVGLFHLLFHGYVVLATSLGYLRRAPIRR